METPDKSPRPATFRCRVCGDPVTIDPDAAGSREVALLQHCGETRVPVEELPQERKEA